MCSTIYLSQRDLAVLTRHVRIRRADPRGAESAVRRLAQLAETSLPLSASAGAAPRVSLGASERYRVAACGAGVHRRAAGDTDAVVIACPQDAQAMLPRVPVLSPLALGLLGHAEGCMVEIELALGRTLQLEIVEVRPPSGLPHRPATGDKLMEEQAMSDIEHAAPERQPGIEERIAAAGRRIADLQRRLDTALAELAHARRRAGLELEAAGRYGHADLARSLLPLRDALDAAAQVETRDAAALREGLALAGRQLATALERRHG